MKTSLSLKLAAIRWMTGSRDVTLQAIFLPHERGDVRWIQPPGTKMDARINRISTSFSAAWLNPN